MKAGEPEATSSNMQATHFLLLAFVKADCICPKCGKPTWAPYVMVVTKKYGQVYRYQVYRHPDGRRRTPRKCTVKAERPGWLRKLRLELSNGA